MTSSREVIRWARGGIVFVLGLGPACSSDPNFADETNNDGDDNTDADTDSDTEDEDRGLDCHEALMIGPASIGEPCNNHGDCRTRVCEVYQTFLPEDAGVCLDWPTDCRTRVMATARDALTGTPIEGMTVYVSPITGLISDPRGTQRFAEGVSGEHGIIDITSDAPISSFIAIGGVVEGDDYELSGFTVAAPIDEEGHYAPAVSYRDWYAVAKSDLAAWNEALTLDPVMASYVPLESNGGAVGLVRTWDYNSVRVAGATVYAADSASQIVVRYLNEDGITFNSEATTSSGIYVLVGAGLGESILIGPGDRLQPSPDLARAGRLASGIWVMAPAVVLDEVDEDSDD